MALKFILLSFFLINSFNLFANSEVLKKEIENLEKTGTDNLDQSKIDSLQEMISKSENNEYQLEERFNKLIDVWQKKKINKSYFAAISFLTWTFPEKIKDPQGINSMNSQEAGYCLGGGHDWQNAYWGYGVDLCLGIMKADAGIKYGDQTYTDIGAPVYSVISRPSIFWRPGDRVKLILYVPLVYRNALISGSTDIEILPQNKFFMGLFVGADWDFSNFFLSTSMGKIFQFESSSWIISLGYKFN